MLASDFHYVVFDGTSAFVCSFDDLETLDADCKVIRKFANLSVAEGFCDKENELIMN